VAHLAGQVAHLGGENGTLSKEKWHFSWGETAFLLERNGTLFRR